MGRRKNIVATASSSPVPFLCSSLLGAISTSSTSSTRMSDTSSRCSEDDDSKPNLVEFDRQLRIKHTRACTAMTNGRFKKAVREFEGVLADLLDRYGESHHRIGAALHNVAIANLRAGHLDDAMDAIEEAVRIRKKTLGRDSPKVADSLVEFGIILLSMKEYSDSLEIFQEALEMRRAEADDMILPDDVKESKLKIAKVMNNIGCVNFERGKLEEAKKSFDEAISMQKNAFGAWSPLMMLTDVTRPGFLTLASTLCNRGYIDLEQENYKSAIQVFTESLKIQKSLLRAENKLVLSTLDNLGFAHIMRHEYDRALRVYQELLSIQEESYGDAQKECSESIAKVVYCQLRLMDFDASFQNLEKLEDLYQARGKELELKATQKLMGDVNYQIFKYPSLAESANRAFGCGGMACNSGVDDDLDLAPWVPKKPENGSKMSGHRVTFA